MELDLAVHGLVSFIIIIRVCIVVCHQELNPPSVPLCEILLCANKRCNNQGVL